VKGNACSAGRMGHSCFMSDEKPHTEERIAWLSVRDAISWLNEAPDRHGSFWDFAKVVRATFTQERADFLA